MRKIRASRRRPPFPAPRETEPRHGHGMADDLPRLLALETGAAPAGPSPADSGRLERRRALQLLGGAGVVLLAGCAAKTTDTNAAAAGSTSTTAGAAATTATTARAGSSSSSTSTSSSSSSTAGSSTAGSSTSGSNVAIPEETAGPYPGDGSNGPDVLAQNGVLRTDIRSSFGSATGVATGVPLAVTFQLVTAGSGAPLADAAVYVWHCDAVGDYSMYTGSAKNQNYLRGVATSDSAGLVTFQSIFPGAYPGRWPHIHFEVSKSAADALKAANVLATSQIALPEAACNQVYARKGYEQSSTNMKRTSLAQDMVFGDDGGVRQLATMTGAVDNGLTATLRVPV